MTDDVVLPRLLVTEPSDFSPVAMARLRARFYVDTGPLSRATLAQTLGLYDVVFVRFGHQFDETMLGHAKEFSIIASPTTGLDHIDMAAAAKRGIQVLSLRGEHAFLKTIHATAELTWGLILALARQIPGASRHVAEGGWDRDRFKGIELAGRTLGVVGYGRLGERVAHYGLSFGMRILACDPTAEMPDCVSNRSLDGLCAEADIITVHVTSKSDNDGMIGQKQFAAMKPSALFINTSRGDVIDERALLKALRQNRLAGAALDVLKAEYDPQAVKLAADLRNFARESHRLIITPHVGGATFDSMGRTEEYMVERLFNALDRGESRRAAPSLVMPDQSR